MRKGYAKNPYAIVWYMIFWQWGVKDINFIQKFFLFDDCISGIHLNKFYFDKDLKKIMNLDSLDVWKETEYYYKWILKEKGEKFKPVQKIKKFISGKRIFVRDFFYC